MLKKWGIGFVSLAVVFGILAGCGGTGGGNTAADAAKETGKTVQQITDNEPVTVSVLMHNGFLKPDEVQKYILDPVAKLHPNITIDFKETGKGNNLEDYVARGESPDIFIESVANLNSIEPLALNLDMEPLIKKFNIDLSRYVNGTMEAIRSTNSKKQIIALPFDRPFFALYYNKDIFDKFAAPYPKDGMTWDDAIELAKKLTRTDGGVQYRGLEANVLMRTASQLNLPYIDEKTGKAAVNSAKWKNFVDKMLSIYQIPGNEGYKVNGAASGQFLKDRTLAMLAINNMLTNMKQVTDMNWDLTSFPTFKEAPGVEPEFSGLAMVPTSVSKHKDAAMEVISTVISDEVLIEISKDGYFVPFKDPKFQKAFATNLDYAKGKNTAALFKTTPAVPVYHSPIWPQERNIMMGGFTQLEKNRDKDVNTFLRDMEEQINQKVSEAQAK